MSVGIPTGPPTPKKQKRPFIQSIKILVGEGWTLAPLTRQNTGACDVTRCVKCGRFVGGTQWLFLRLMDAEFKGPLCHSCFVKEKYDYDP